jgi:LruC domain-containing protein
MVVNQKRTVEIHLPDFAPTLLADQSLLGTGDDASVAEKGLTYKSTKGLPWGILIFEPFDYPVERAMITDAHLFMAEWAVSGGKLYTDWYRDLKGYRNYDRIFKK